MIILDTNHLTVIQRQNEPAYSHLRIRLHQAVSEVGTTIVRQCRRANARLARCHSSLQEFEQEIVAYRQLRLLFTFFSNLPVLNFDELAAVQFSKLQRGRVRLGSMDLKIAAIALSQDALLLSRNLKDFRQVPGLLVQDWTHAET
jgi:tRNA(fMet)-specific endonuclease VapC